MVSHLSPPVAIELIVQKDVGDCGICALAMFLGKSYAEVFQAAAAIDSQPSRGLWVKDLIQVARKFGMRLKKIPIDHVPAVEEATGIVDLSRHDADHVAVLFQGVILNPADGLVYDYDAYLARTGFRPISLLVPVERGKGQAEVA